MVVALFALPAEAASRDDRKPFTAVQRQLDQIREARKLLQRNAPYSLRDARGRAKFEDIEQWAYTQEMMEIVESKLGEARTAKPSAAKAALTDARRTMDDAMAKALDIASYWNQNLTIVWRERWTAFATGNGMPPEPFEPAILDAELAAIEYLNVGDFRLAANAMSAVETALRSAIDSATVRLVRDNDPATLKFISRFEVCPKPDAARPAEMFYPPAAKRRGEQGVIVLRAHVNEAGCATKFAVMVSSGYPDLDQAALKVAEKNLYRPGSDTTFKVRFQFGTVVPPAVHELH